MKDAWSLNWRYGYDDLTVKAEGFDERLESSLYMEAVLYVEEL